MNVQVVTSASKKAECLSGAPAAIFVLTGAEIQRQGFATLPEVLRTVPGLYVSQTNAHTWQISARGFSDVNNNKMLVLVDGRSAYSMEPGTVYWDTLDISPENIDRVEVIRGPGGALWGDNAVNGVTNIVLKSADQMQGALLSTGASPETGYTATVRYGGQFGSQVSYSFFGRAAYWEPFHNPDGSPGPDHFAFPQGGLRVDWVASSADAISLEGSGYDGRSGQTGLQNNIPNSYLVKGGEVAFRWKHTLSKRASTDALAYCDWYARVGVPAEKRNRCDIEFQNSLQFNPRRSLIWGSSFFSTGDDLTSDPAPYIPERRRSNVVSAFAQCEYAILPDRLRAGSSSNTMTTPDSSTSPKAAWCGPRARP